MRRIATRDVGKNVRKGRIYDWPLTTWKQLAKSASLPFEAFSASVEEAAQQTVTKDKRKSYQPE
jgi:hypothetical protein